jgi:hypothetical protein
MTTPARFDELIHPSTRLSIVALLASADWTDFAFVHDRLGLSDSALSKQFGTLEANQCARLEGDHGGLGIVREQHAGQAPEVRHVAHQHEVSRVRGDLLGPHRGIITGRERLGELDRCTEHLAPGLRGLPSPRLSPSDRCVRS